jgi:hypothetical protein
MSPRPDQAANVVDRATLEREVERIVAAADGAGATLRVLGSLGVSLHCLDGAALLPSFARTYADIDFAGYRREARIVARVLGSMGYVEDRALTIATEGKRGLYDQPFTGIHIDVFFDRLEFCHPIALDGRLDRDRPTIPLAELLLSKLQIVRINEKDVVDVILLLLDHELGAGDADTIDMSRVAGLCAADWGLWRTVTLNLGKVTALAGSYAQLEAPRRDRVAAQVGALVARLDAEPKTFAWRARARIGERRQWWTDVEEVR